MMNRYKSLARLRITAVLVAAAALFATNLRGAGVAQCPSKPLYDIQIQEDTSRDPIGGDSCYKWLPGDTLHCPLAYLVLQTWVTTSAKNPHNVENHYKCFVFGVGKIDRFDPSAVDDRMVNPCQFTAWMPRDYILGLPRLGVHGSTYRTAVEFAEIHRVESSAELPNPHPRFFDSVTVDLTGLLVEVRVPAMPCDVDPRRLVPVLRLEME